MKNLEYFLFNLKNRVLKIYFTLTANVSFVDHPMNSDPTGTHLQTREQLKIY